MSFKDSQTYKNLNMAFMGECQAYTKYELYAKKAKKEGMNLVADIFNETAHNEFEHAKLFFKKMNDGDIPLTVNNLADCIVNENHENKVMYREFANDAKKEGYEDVANLFNMIADIEATHANNYEMILKTLKNNELFKNDSVAVWVCQNCGHIHKGNEAPKVCPVCNHPQGYFYKQK